MSMQDPIADMLTRIRNAQRAGKSEVSMDSSRLKVAIIKVLQEEGYVGEHTTEELGTGHSLLRLRLRYVDDQPVIQELKRFSSPGLRRYAGSGELPRIRNGLGIAVISTSRGVMSDRAARTAGLGGEILCTVF